jgi:hypothetical protein
MLAQLVSPFVPAWSRREAGAGEDRQGRITREP